MSAIESLEIVPLSNQDRKILHEVLNEDSRIDISIPDEIDNPGELWSTLETCCRVAGTISKAADKIKPIVGRLLVVLKKYPELHQERGYPSYEDFMCKGMKELFGISRTEAYACRKVAEAFPDLTVSEFQKIGVSKLYFLSSVTNSEDRNYEPLIQAAQDPDVNMDDLRTLAAELTFAEKGEYEITTVVVKVPKTVAKMWKEFSTDAAIQAYVHASSSGSGGMNEGIVFSRMIEECSTEWLAQGQHILDAGRNDAVIG